MFSGAEIMRGGPFLCWLAILTATASNAFGGVFSATIEKISVENRTITVKVSRKDLLQTFDVRGSAVITIDGKKASLDDLEAGQTVSLTTNDFDEVTKVTVRTAARPVEKGEGSPVKSLRKKPGRDDSPEPARGKESSKPEADGPDESSAEVDSGEWPQFRGPNRDNVSPETGLKSKWPNNGPKLAWKQTEIGLGYSSVAVSQGRVFTMGNRGEDEFLLALDARSGRHLWSLRMGDAYHDGTGDGPRGTPTVDGDRVYALGANGDLVCAGIDDGDLAWHVNILQEFGARNITWGISESVLVDGNQVICTPGGQIATMAALDKLTGKTVWVARHPKQPQAAYSSAIAVEVNGIRQYVNFVQTAVLGVKADNGRILWENSKSANGTANCATPLFADNAVFSASGYGTGGALVKLVSKGQNVTAVLGYHTPRMKNHHGGMVLVKGDVYGFDDDVLTCLEMKTGKVAWQDRSVGKGSLTVADGHLYLRSEDGIVGLAEATPKGYKESGRFTQPDRSDKPSWSHPAVVGGKLYLRDMDTLLVYDVKD
jgi:outer membrane protein assembly factor BamB